MFISIPKLEGTIVDSLFIAEELFVIDNSFDIRKKVTKKVGSNNNASDFYSGSALLEFLMEVFRDFHRLFYGNSRLLPWNRPRPLPSISFSIFQFSSYLTI
jgi:hypothetical protein